jgi:hypothetical protein
MGNDATTTEFLDAVEDVREQPIAPTNKRTDEVRDAVMSGKAEEAGISLAEAGLTYPLSGDTHRFKGMKPTVLTIDGEDITVGTWRQAYTEILTRCDAECHDRLMALRPIVSGTKRAVLADNPYRMYSPVKICEGLYAGAHYNSDTLLDVLKRLILDPAGFDYSGISVTVIPGRGYRK